MDFSIQKCFLYQFTTLFKNLLIRYSMILNPINISSITSLPTLWILPCILTLLYQFTYTVSPSITLKYILLITLLISPKRHDNKNRDTCIYIWRIKVSQIPSYYQNQQQIQTVPPSNPSSFNNVRSIQSDYQRQGSRYISPSLQHPSRSLNMSHHHHPINRISTSYGRPPRIISEVGVILTNDLCPIISYLQLF